MANEKVLWIEKKLFTKYKEKDGQFDEFCYIL